MDSIDRREWLYTQSDDAVVAEILGLEKQNVVLKKLVWELAPIVMWVAQSHYGSAYEHADKAREILNRPEVVEILEEVE